MCCLVFGALKETNHFITEYDQPHESQTNKDIMENIHRKGLGGPDSPENEDTYHIGDDDHSPRNDNQATDYHNIINQRNQLNLHMPGGLQNGFSISNMTNNSYREQSLMTPGSNPVIRMLDMTGQQPGGYQSQDTSPRDSHSNSPPSLQIPAGHSSKDVSPVDSPHSHSPPGPQHPHQLHLQPAQLHIPSPHKTDSHFTPMTTMSVPGFPPSMSSILSQAPHHSPDPFSALGQLGQDLRLTTPHHITQWLQQAQPQQTSPVKNEPMSPRRAQHAQQDFAAL